MIVDIHRIHLTFPLLGPAPYTTAHRVKHPVNQPGSSAITKADLASIGFLCLFTSFRGQVQCHLWSKTGRECIQADGGFPDTAPTTYALRRSKKCRPRDENLPVLRASRRRGFRRITTACASPPRVPPGLAPWRCCSFPASPARKEPCSGWQCRRCRPPWI